MLLLGFPPVCSSDISPIMPYGSLCQCLSQTCYPILSITVSWSQGYPRLLPLERELCPRPQLVCERSVIQVHRLTRLPLRWRGRAHASVAFVGGFIETGFALVLRGELCQNLRKTRDGKNEKRVRVEEHFEIFWPGEKMEVGPLSNTQTFLTFKSFPSRLTHCW